MFKLDPHNVVHSVSSERLHSIAAAEGQLDEHRIELIRKAIYEYKALLVSISETVKHYLEREESADSMTLLENVQGVLHELTWYVPEVGELFSDYTDAIEKYENASAATLDEAFGVSRPKGWRQDAARFEAQRGFEIVERVWELREQEGKSIDEAFEAAGCEYGKSASWTSKLFYRVERQHRPLRVSHMLGFMWRFTEELQEELGEVTYQEYLGGITYQEYLASEHASEYERVLFNRYQNYLKKPLKDNEK